jgi:hypothetical protein
MEESSKLDDKQKQAMGQLLVVAAFFESMGLGSLKSQFPTLGFTNGILTDIYDN